MCLRGRVRESLPQSAQKTSTQGTYRSLTNSNTKVRTLTKIYTRYWNVYVYILYILYITRVLNFAIPVFCNKSREYKSTFILMSYSFQPSENNGEILESAKCASHNFTCILIPRV